MRLLIIISSFIIAQAAVIKENLIKINGVCHQEEVLVTNIDRPFLLTVDYDSNTVYFSYTDNEKRTSRTAKYNLDTKEYRNVQGLRSGFAQAVDPITHDVYIGGTYGIYKYNKTTNRGEFLGQRRTNIWSMFYKDTLYYTVFPSQFVYTFANGQATRFEDMKDTYADTFIIDNEDDMFYSNDTGIYSQKKGTKDAVLYKELGDNVSREISLDVKGDVYVCLDIGVYVANKATKTLEKVLELDNGYGVAFDKDNNLLYSDSTNIVRLKPVQNNTC